ncbi:hypothetical protein [Sutterella wadsworthensis]|jgi:hypothetical protein|uniref:hypothetical protein n=1 Tax=Sutterella wadsworthensis TaxID=40545 RepID=UPI0001F604D1|nr:hypothetical protein [Sutterella wadsworthensis]EFW01049.1 hypothetical protein HMPREF9464_01810 [Sutterella wadsworthensis 3_1_45B]
MTIEEVKKMLEALGIKTDELKGAALEKAQAWLDAQKAQMDTETRRKCRVFWGCVTGVMTLVGGVAGFYIAHLIG